MPGKRRALKKIKTVGALIDNLEKIKARIWAKIEHPFRVTKCQFGYRKTRYQGLIKNTEHLRTLFALSNVDGEKTNYSGRRGMSKPAAWKLFKRGP